MRRCHIGQISVNDISTLSASVSGVSSLSNMEARPLSQGVGSSNKAIVGNLGGRSPAKAQENGQITVQILKFFSKFLKGFYREGG